MKFRHTDDTVDGVDQAGLEQNTGSKLVTLAKHMLGVVSTFPP